ncbi:hypothetical protein HMPREF3199_00930 [Enterococcus faecium]|nr:hypothetical protein HMPREF3199_00930 [Enterococcus faecium]
MEKPNRHLRKNHFFAGVCLCCIMRAVDSMMCHLFSTQRNQLFHNLFFIA